jgi:hypothetical protein
MAVLFRSMRDDGEGRPLCGPTARLPKTLVMRRDPNDPSRHGFVEPVHAMTLQDYQEALATSRGMWVRA